MDASTRILRGLAVAELALAFAGAALSLWLWDTLPPALRDYEAHEPELFDSFVPGVVLAFALLPVGVAACVGVILLWRPARVLYTAAAAGSVAITPLLGPDVEPVWAGLLSDLASTSGGAILALLYLSPAARHFGPAPAEPPGGGPAPRDRLSSGALLVSGAALGFLAGVGAVVVGFAAFGVFAERASEGARNDGRTYGASRSDAACFEEARRYQPESAFASPSHFLDGCLEAAKATAAFCEGVPSYGAEGSRAWQVTRCEGDPDFDTCTFLAETVQEHCHPDAATDP